MLGVLYLFLGILIVSITIIAHITMAPGWCIDLYDETYRRHGDYSILWSRIFNESHKIEKTHDLKTESYLQRRRD
jgi:hypothetical protein